MRTDLGVKRACALLRRNEWRKKALLRKTAERKALVKAYASRRASLKAIVMDRSKPAEERFKAQLKLAALPRNSSTSRVRNRCELTGRPRGFLPENENFTYRPAGSGLKWPASRHGQIELVKGRRK